MKKISNFLLLIASIVATQTFAQKSGSSEKYGSTLNLGVGVGYYGYIGHTAPALHADYEFDVAKNFTIAPFITIISYSDYYYWGNKQYPYRNYKYTHTIMPVGVKGTYYFDKALGANSKWDFYLAGSAGFAIRKTRWENGYYGETTIENGTSGIYLDGHAGGEFHASKKVGIYFDLSTGISTAGIALHL